MSDTPSLADLHVFADDCTCRTQCPKGRPATPADLIAAVASLSPSEVLEAARQHVDYEVAAEALGAHYGLAPNRVSNGGKKIARDVVNAALGIEGEET